jgi:hypothetical protein
MLSMVIMALVGTIVAIPAWFLLMRKKIGRWISERRDKKINGKSSELPGSGS